MKRWIAVALVLAGLGALVWVAGSVLIAPAPRTVPMPLDLAVEPLAVTSDNGELAAWALPADSSRGVVVLMHGVRADRSSQLGRMRLFHGANYDVVAFDFQAHGESPGDAITFGAREQHDAVAVVAAARRRFPGRAVAVVGQSMGGAAAILAGPGLDADALVVEAVYASIDRATRNRLGMRLGRAGEMLAPLLTAQLSARLAVSADRLRPVDAIAHINAPVFVLGGARDAHAQTDETQALYDAAPSPQSLWMVEGAVHQDLYRYAPADYRQRVLGFLGRHLGE